MIKKKYIETDKLIMRYVGEEKIVFVMKNLKERIKKYSSKIKNTENNDLGSGVLWKVLHVLKTAYMFLQRHM